MIGRKGASAFLLAGVLLGSCTPHQNPSPVKAVIVSARILQVDAGGDPRHRTTLPVLAVNLSIINPGAEVRLLGYRYASSQGAISEALMDRRLVEESRSKLGQLVRLGLPTVFPANSTTPGWVFFRTSDTKGQIHLSLRDVYGRFSSLDIPVGTAFPGGTMKGQGNSSPGKTGP